MEGKFFFFVFFVFLQQFSSISTQRQWVLPTTTASEMRNPYTWYWPYAIAGSEAYRDFFVNAQQIHNQLYTQAKITGAFNQAGDTAGYAANQAGQTANGMMGGPGGWNGPQGPGGQGGWNGPQGPNGMGGVNG